MGPTCTNGNKKSRPRSAIRRTARVDPAAIKDSGGDRRNDRPPRSACLRAPAWPARLRGGHEASTARIALHMRLTRNCRHRIRLGLRLPRLDWRTVHMNETRQPTKNENYDDRTKHGDSDITHCMRLLQPSIPRAGMGRRSGSEPVGILSRYNIFVNTLLRVPKNQKAGKSCPPSKDIR